MMNYEVFKRTVTEQILSFMPENFKDFKVNINTVNKVNGALDGLGLLPPDYKNNVVTPTIYINHLYDDYSKDGNLQKVLKMAAYMLSTAYCKAPSEVNLDVESARNSIIMCLVNTRQNEQMLLQDVPYREFLDLSIMYRFLVEDNREGMVSAIVTHTLAEKLEMNEQELYEAALLNTKRLLPPVIININELMDGINVGMQEEMSSVSNGEMSGINDMYVISNERRINGAAIMLYEGELDRLADKLGGDLYILPSSIHEVIAVSAKRGEPEELAQMVNEINMNLVDLEERLSNQVYYYDKKRRTLTLATDTSNKRLDGTGVENN